MAIAKTGFVALSTLDAGFYGKGVYFTTSAPYSLHYAYLSQEPVLILSFVTPGNVYPVVENPKEVDSLLASAIKPGYNSHYVLTCRNGMVITQIETETFYDELVVDQESQVLPAYILVLDHNNIRNILGSQEISLPPTPKKNTHYFER